MPSWIRAPGTPRVFPNLRTSLAVILVALLFVRLVWTVLRSVVDTPFMDEWIIWSDVLLALDNHSMSWEFLVAPYNGHRLAVVRLVLLALLPTRWSIYPQVLFTIAVSAVFMAVLWRLYRSTAGRIGARIDPWAAVALAAFVFSCADINRLWGMGLEWHVVVLASTLCLVLLSAQPFRWWRLVAAGLSASVACFSVAAGLLVWIIGLPVLWIATAGTVVRVRALVCWGAAAAAFCSLYLRNFPDYGRSTGPALTLAARVVDSAWFVASYVGLPIQVRYDPSLFLIFGIAGIILHLGYYVRFWKHRRAVLIPLVPWLAAAAFSVGTGAMIAAARPNAPHVALYYITTGRLFWIASIGVVCLILSRTSGVNAEPRSRWRRWRIPAIALLLVALDLQQTRVTLESWQPLREGLLQAGHDAPDVCAGNWDAVSRITYPVDYIRSRYAVLSKHATSFTRSPQLSQLDLAQGSGVGAVNSAVVEASPPDNGPPCVHLSGWAVDPMTGGAAREVLLVQGGKVIKRGAVNQPTPHLIARYDNPKLGRSGWGLFISEPRWPRTSSSIAVYAVSVDGRSAYRLDLAAGVKLPYGNLDRYHEYPLGFVVDLSQVEEAVPYQLTGFSGPDPGGRWTDASEASISLVPGPATKSALKLVASVDAFVTPQHPTQRADIFVNSQPVGRWEFKLGDPMREREVTIPSSAVASGKRLAITFRLPDAIAPATLNLSPDTRLLGMRMARFRVVEAR